MELTVVRVRTPSAEGEAKTKARSVGAALLERAEQLLDFPRREPAALILDLNEDVLGADAHP